MDIKALSIQVQAKGVQQAANALGSLAKNAAQLDPVLTRAKAGLDNISKISLGSTNLQINSTSESITRLRNTTKDFSNIGQGFKGLSNAMTSTASAVEKLVGSTAGLQAFNTQLQTLKETLSEMKGMSGVLTGIGQSAANASSRQAGGGGSRYPADEAEKYAKVQQRLIQNIEREAVITSQGKVAWLEMQAARKGVSEQAAPFIAQLKAQQTGLKQGEMSTRAYTAALRQVPAQFTDIATQLAGGQNPMLILLQQGGQLKDMFGGVGNAAKAAGGYLVTLLTNPVVLASAAVAALGYALYKTSVQLTAYESALITTNNYVGTSVGQFVALRNGLEGVNGTQSAVIDAFTEIAATGKITGAAVNDITAATVNFSRITGSEIEKVVAEYASLSKKPSEAIISLNEKYHFLTASIYAQIKALEDQGQTLKATELAQTTLAAAQEDMSKRLTENAGLVKRAWLSVKDTFSEVLYMIGRIGKEDDASSLVAINKQIDFLQSTMYTKSGKIIESVKREVSVLEERRAVIQKTVDEQNKQSERVAKETQDRETNLNAYRGILDLQTKSANQAQKSVRMENEIAAARKLYADAAKGDTTAQNLTKQYTLEQAISDIRERYKDKGQGASADRLAGLKAEQQAIELDIANLREFGSAYDKVTENAKKLFTINNQLADNRTDPKKRKDLLEEKALLEQITQVEQTRNNLIESAKGAQKWDEVRSKSIAATAGINDHIDALRAGEAETARMTATQKLLAQAEDEAAYSMDMMTRSAAANSVEVLRNQVAAESLAKAEQEVSKIKKETAVINEKGSASVESLIAKYKEEEASVSLSNQQREKRSALLEIEKQRAQSVAVLQAQLTQLSTQYTEESKLKTAAINEQITALNNQAAAQARVVAAQPDRKALEGSSVGQDALGAFNSFYDGLQTRQQLMADFFSQSYSTMSDALTNFTTTGKLDFKSFTASVLKMISEMMVKMLLLKAIQYGVNAFGGGVGVSTIGSQDFMGPVGTRVAAKGAYFTGSVAKFAKGGTFTNSIVSRPTPFKFANGGGFGDGLMGEAGPEAIMPLARGPNGKLGIQASGGGGNNITINVVVNSDGSSQTVTEGTSEQDGRALGDMIKQSVISIIMEQKRPGGVLAD